MNNHDLPEAKVRLCQRRPRLTLRSRSAKVWRPVPAARLATTTVTRARVPDHGRNPVVVDRTFRELKPGVCQTSGNSNAKQQNIVVHALWSTRCNLRGSDYEPTCYKDGCIQGGHSLDWETETRYHTEWPVVNYENHSWLEYPQANVRWTAWDGCVRQTLLSPATKIQFQQTVNPVNAFMVPGVTLPAQ